MPEEKGKSKTELSVPMAIIVAGIIIAASIIATKNSGQVSQYAVSGGPDNNPGTVEPVKPADINMRPVSADDHIRGNINAPVKIVEYSDPECPFCKRFFGTMKQVMDTYGASGQVAWVYRHFPLDSLHPKSRHESEALECAGEQGGEDKFWQYLDRLMDITPSNNQLDPAELPKIASFIGIDVTKFNTCLNSGKYATKIQKDVDDAIAAGGTGTPYSVVLSANGQKFPVDGAYPYDSVKSIVDVALQGK